jgi:hypothetical protein
MIDLMGKMGKDDDADSKGKSSDSDFLELVHTRYKDTQAVWEPIFRRFREDLAFEQGNQWDEGLKSRRTKQNLSCLVINKISAKVKYIVNNARSAMPAVKVHAIRDGASENTAKVFDGLIKSIEYQHNAKQARVLAHKSNVIGGLGAWRILVYADDEGNKELKYERVLDPTTILMDPAAKAQDFADAEFAFVINWVPNDVFEDQYPDVDTKNYAPEYSAWFSKDAVQVVEYWVRGDDGLFDQYLICGDEILHEETEYAGKYLPIMYLTGEEYCIDDVRDYKGIVRDVKDMQILHNLSKSRTADYIARSAQAEWLVEAEQVSDYLEQWKKVNTGGSGLLLYNGTSSGGKPQRIDPLAPPTGLMEASKETDEDIRMTIGIRDPLADVPSSQSGKAIQLQISQGNIGTFEFADKLNELVRYEGKVLVDLIPKVYDYPHIREIMGLDGNVTTVPLNQEYIDNGEQVMHDLTRGKYLVTISSGASYESQRSETADKLVELVGKYPDMMAVAGDLIVRNMDFVGADELADRLKAGIAPNILAASNSTNADKSEQAVMQLQAQLAQAAQQAQEMQAQFAQLQQEHGALQQQVQTKQAEIGAKAQADTQVAHVKVQAETQTMQTKYELELQLQREKAQFEREMALLKMQHEQRLKEMELGHDASKTTFVADHQAQLQTALKQADGEQKLEQIQFKADADQMMLDIKAGIEADADTVDHRQNLQMLALNHDHEIDKLSVQADSNAMMAQLNAALAPKPVVEKKPRAKKPKPE